MKRGHRSGWRWLIVCGLALNVAWVQADEVRVAVAANFQAPMQKIAEAFAQDTTHTAQLIVGSTGKFYLQITQGAPFHVLLSADDETPVRLEREGFAVSGTRFTYATGRLALWSVKPQAVDDKGEVLRSARGDKLAIADPKLAPYGAAAMQVLTRLGVLSQWQSQLVQGENIAQTYQFVLTENASLGFVALSQVWRDGRLTRGSMWLVPQSLHDPLRQDAVLLQAGNHQPAARALLNYLRGERAQAIIRAYGYAL